MFIIYYLQSTIHNSLFTIHYLHCRSLSNGETIVDETSFYIMKTIYYLQSTIYYLQFTIHYLHCNSLYRSHSVLPIKLLNSSLSSRFLILKFYAKKELLTLFKTTCTHTWPERPVYTEGAYASSPRPVERSRPGGTLIQRNIKRPQNRFARLWSCWSLAIFFGPVSTLKNDCSQ